MSGKAAEVGRKTDEVEAAREAEAEGREAERQRQKGDARY